jgi:hypothetical protein
MKSLTVYMSFHKEGLQAKSSIDSLKLGLDYANQNGIDLRAVASLDRPSAETKLTIVNSDLDWHEVIEYDVGDLGSVRRDLAKRCETDYLAFQDGDDLIGSEWLTQAFNLAEKQADTDWVIHPEYVYYFSEEEYANFQFECFPNDVKQNFFIRHIPTTSSEFEPKTFIFNNVFTSNILCPSHLYEKFPYLDVDIDEGFGIEDWTWNALTVLGGVRHLVAEDSVHLVRVKQTNSLGKLNSARKLLPKIGALFSDADARVSNSSEIQFKNTDLPSKSI